MSGLRTNEELSNVNLLLTGVTGYLGQLFLAKLLVAAPDIGKIYVLIRKQESISSEERFKALLSTSLAFEMVERFCVETKREDYFHWVMKKCIVVEGDVTQTKLAIRERDAIDISNHVHVIVHAAADVSFTNTFEVAMTTNLLGTVNVVEFARNCRHLKLFNYVSTAYVSANQRFDSFLHEAKQVALPFQVNTLVTAVREMDINTMRRCEEDMVNEHWPNSYVMSKACAEAYVCNIGAVPVTIIRPSMIACAWKDIHSERGWNLASNSGPTLCTYAIALGALTIAPIHSTTENTLDLVPSDYCANVMVAALVADVHDAVRSKNAPVNIYYAVLGQHRLPARVFFPTAVSYFKQHPHDLCMRKPRVALYSGKSFDRQLLLRYTAPIQALSSLQPAFVGVARKPAKKLLQTLELVAKLINVSRWAVEGEFEFNDSNVSTLFTRFHEDDRSVLWNNLDQLDAQDFIESFCHGVTVLMANVAREEKKKKMTEPLKSQL